VVLEAVNRNRGDQSDGPSHNASRDKAPFAPQQTPEHEQAVVRLDQADQPHQHATRGFSIGGPAQQGDREQAIDPDLDLAERKRLHDRVKGQREAGDERKSQSSLCPIAVIAAYASELQLQQRGGAYDR
jgi:hypothetical protein